jgi:hypothetical protein
MVVTTEELVGEALPVECLHLSPLPCQPYVEGDEEMLPSTSTMAKGGLYLPPGRMWGMKRRSDVAMLVEEWYSISHGEANEEEI